MSVSRRDFLALLGAGGAAAALPPVLGTTRATARSLPPARSVRNAGTNRYLEGLYAPVSQEVTAFDLPITGVLPPELDGRYLRNGPNPAGAVNPDRYHWFVGDGMVHGIRLRDGRAEWYRNRWVRSRAAAAALGEPAAPGEHPDWGSWANTNVISHAGRDYAIIEGGGRPAELSEELGTVRFSDFEGTLPYGFTAHPKRDPRTGQLHAATYWFKRPNMIDYTVVGADGLVVHQAGIPVPGNPMVHDCSITETSMVLYDLPCTLSIEAAVGGWPFPYRWDPSYGARLGVLPLGGTAEEVQWFEIEPCYIFHPVNAFDDGTTVVIDVVRHPKMFATDFFGPNEGSPAIWRYVLDRATGAANGSPLDDRALEFPRVDERVVGRRHRYSWAVEVGLGDGGDVLWPGVGLVRHDARTGASESRTFGPGRTVGEAIFVPRPNGIVEDDGWYLALVHDQATDRSELVVIAADDWLGEPVATVHLPVRVPLGFHGNWVPARPGSPPPSSSTSTTSTPSSTSTSTSTSTTSPSTSSSTTTTPASTSTSTPTTSTTSPSPSPSAPAASPATAVRSSPRYTG